MHLLPFWFLFFGGLIPTTCFTQIPHTLVGYWGSDSLVNYQTTVVLLNLQPSGTFTYSVLDHWWGPSIHAISDAELVDQVSTLGGHWKSCEGSLMLQWSDSTSCYGSASSLVQQADSFWTISDRLTLNSKQACEVPPLQALEQFLLQHPWLDPWIQKMASLPPPSHRRAG
jgi:hypothetical protein